MFVICTIDDDNVYRLCHETDVVFSFHPVHDRITGIRFNTYEEAQKNIIQLIKTSKSKSFIRLCEGSVIMTEKHTKKILKSSKGNKSALKHLVMTERRTQRIKDHLS